MNNKIIGAGLLAVIIFQTCVLAGEYLGAVYPLWTGKAIKLRTQPVDPRSLFRGNYARLRYAIANIPAAEFKHLDKLRNGEVVYVTLKGDENSIYSFASASLDKPASGVFIRGRVANDSWRYTAQNYHINYGIEAYFAPKEKAIALERKLGNSLAIVMVADSGRATLKDVVTAESQ